jgi:hypothetical protein
LNKFKQKIQMLLKAIGLNASCNGTILLSGLIRNKIGLLLINIFVETKKNQNEKIRNYVNLERVSYNESMQNSLLCEKIMQKALKDASGGR